MGMPRHRLSPTLFAVVHTVLMLLTVPTLEEPPSTLAWITACSATVLTVAALARRDRTPLAALGAILAVSVLGQILTIPDMLGLIPGLAVLMAIFSVTTVSDWTVALGATVTAAVVQPLPMAVRHGFDGVSFSDWLIAVGLYLMVSALGAGRRHRLRERQAVEERLARAAQERAQAADTERERLAQELHDISAHHLTSVVVSVEAARRLGEKRPELGAEALAFASRTARETQSALRRLVEVMHVGGTPAPASMTAPIEALIAGFGKLGRPISVSLPADLAGPTAEAVHGIVREALTNALRYAPGASVGVRAERAGDVLRLTVDNGKPPGGTGGDKLGLGSGRGVAGMRQRAAAVGGQLSAGPRPGGGWRVEALLPDAPPARRPVGGRRRDFTREQRIADGAVFGSAAVLSWSVALMNARNAGHGVQVCLLLALVLTVHALPLLWRRRAPWLVLAAVGATALVWPVLLRGNVLPPSGAAFLVGGGVVELAAVYAVAAYGRALRPATAPAALHAGPPASPVTYPSGSRLSYLSVPAATLAFGISMAATLAADGTLLGEPIVSLPALLLYGFFTLVVLFVFLGLGFTAVWGAGWLMHRRRRRELSSQDAALTALLAQARERIHSERQRVAGGLQETVFQQTTRVISSAEAGSLDDVAAASRAALATMRRLLGSLDAGKAPTVPRGTAAQGAFRT
ncbi:sensor histidine kinase [Streptomyces sp. NEAU-W12]|uniref:sensor histidine kinase n=1 Tax=Streptomyces sp. NEAU-W12 TaxID=2994668 RepID=UPI00224AE9BE|nr:histidine kinase [Streptomyces sp. NEAU-W12]MCX2928041.1 histidine kinase [Streptomyces sp. NEAU-W12]MCX2928245.1 histidine kinase [Streptomyces sp. NEAU-W12]